MTESLYQNIFKDEFQELVAIKKSLGFEYNTQSAAFRRIDEFFVKNDSKVKSISKELCNDWCQKRDYESVNNQAHRYQIYIFTNITYSLSINYIIIAFLCNPPQ